MNLPASQLPREALHIRSITCTAHLRSDGLIDVEGTMVDTRPGGAYLLERGRIDSEEPIHDMSIRITLDQDLIIQDAAAVMRAAPYSTCKTINASYSSLVGLKIGPGFTGAVKRMFRGTSGCTHLTELIPSIATTALQAIWGASQPSDSSSRASADTATPNLSPIDGCHALKSSGDIIQRYYPGLKAKGSI